MTPTGPGYQDWRRLNTRMLLIHPIQDLLRSVPTLVGILVVGSSSGHWLGSSLFGVMFVVAGGTVRWLTTTYRITSDQVQRRHGVLRRQTLAVPRGRVRTVELTAHPLHRLLGLARITIGTGQSDLKGGSEVRLDALGKAEASRLREELLNHSRAGVPAAHMTRAESLTEVDLVSWRPAWIRYGPFTLSGFVTIGALAGSVSQILSQEHVDPRRLGPLRYIVERLSGMPLWLAILTVILALLVAGTLASTIGYALAFWGFRLTRHAAGTLQVSRGLLTTRVITIEERRLRGIELSEPLLLRAARGARCVAITTGLRVGRGAERGGSLLFPPGPREEAQGVASRILRGHESVTCPLINHGPRAQRRRFTRALGASALAVAGLVLLWWQDVLPAWTWEISLLVFPGGMILAADRYRALGHALVDGYLVSRWGSLVRRRWVLSCDGIIGWNIERSFFQRRAGLATLTATTAAGRQRYRVPDVTLVEALCIAHQAIPDLLTPFISSGAPHP
jgi:putative membrane protein